jgi:outer membrane protein TolC
MFYQRGKSTYLEVLSAQVDLTQAKASYVRAIGDYQNANAKLDRVVGAVKSLETEKRGNGETETVNQGGQS